MEFFGYVYIEELDEFMVSKNGCDHAVTVTLVRHIAILDLFHLIHDLDKRIERHRFAYEMEREIERAERLIWVGDKHSEPIAPFDLRNDKLF